MTRKTALIIAIPSLMGLSCCCAAFALPFGIAGLFGWAESGIAVPTSSGTAAISLRVSEWYLGPGEPTYEVLLRRTVRDRVEYRRFSAQDVHDRLAIPELPAEGIYDFSVRLPNGRGGMYDPGPLGPLWLHPDETADVVVVVHGGVDLHGVVTHATDGSVVADVDVLPEPFASEGDATPQAMVFGRSDATGTFVVAGICGFGHGPLELDRGVTFRREGFRERRVRLAFPATCAEVTPANWRVPLEPLASSTMSIAPDLSIVRLDPTSPAARAGLRTGDRIVELAGAPTTSSMPTSQSIVEQFDRRDEELWMRVVASDGTTREIRTVLHEPDVIGH